MDRPSGCTWQEGQVAIGVVHKLEMFVQPFSNKEGVGKSKGFCSNLRVVRDLFHAVLQFVGASFKHLSLNSSHWYVKTLWQEKDYCRVVLLCVVRLYTGWLFHCICVPRME